MLISCTTFAGQFAFVGASSFILIDGFHVAPTHVAFYFGAAALAIMASSLAGRALLAGASRRAPCSVAARRCSRSAAC